MPSDRIKFLKFYSMIRATLVHCGRRTFGGPESLPADPRAGVGIAARLFPSAGTLIAVPCRLNNAGSSRWLDLLWVLPVIFSLPSQPLIMHFLLCSTISRQGLIPLRKFSASNSPVARSHPATPSPPIRTKAAIIFLLILPSQILILSTRTTANYLFA